LSEIAYSPPKCPQCGTELFRVAETVYETYTFNSKTGTYKEDGDAEISCINCGADLYDVFPDGVCNYVDPSKKSRT